jgi:hypothetical protein
MNPLSPGLAAFHFDMIAVSSLSLSLSPFISVSECTLNQVELARLNPFLLITNNVFQS